MCITSVIKPGVFDRKLLQVDVGGCKITYGVSLGNGGFKEHKSLKLEEYIRRFNGEAHNGILCERRDWAVSNGCFAYAPCILSPMLYVSYHDIVIQEGLFVDDSILCGGEYVVCFIEGELSRGLGASYINTLALDDKKVSCCDLFGLMGLGTSNVWTGWYAGAWGSGCDCIMLCVSKKEVRFLYEICSRLLSGMLAVVEMGESLCLICLDKYIRFVIEGDR